MNRFLLASALVAGLIATNPAEAAKQIRVKGPVVVDAKLGYVAARIGPSSEKGDAETIVLYRIDPETGRLRTRDKNAPNPVVKGEDAVALIGGGKNMSFGVVPVTGGSTSIFLTSLTPGEWVIVGTQSTCACMGSYRFTVRPGEITDIGTIVTGAPGPDAPFESLRGPAVAADLLEKPYTVPEAIFAAPAAETDALPQSLAKFTHTRAELALIRFDNAGGWLVNRMSGLPPIEPATAETAAAVSDPRYPAGSGANRWPDVADKTDTKKKKN